MGKPRGRVTYFPPGDPWRHAKSAGDPGREPVASVTFEDGREVTVYAPPPELQYELSLVMRDLTTFAMFGVLQRVVELCTDVRFEGKTRDLAALVMAILSTWDIDRQPLPMRGWYRIVRKDLERWVRSHLALSHRVELALQPHPELNDKYDAVVDEAYERHLSRVGHGEERHLSDQTSRDGEPPAFDHLVQFEERLYRERKPLLGKILSFMKDKTQAEVQEVIAFAWGEESETSDGTFKRAIGRLNELLSIYECRSKFHIASGFLFHKDSPE